jgi:hypothetical protein
MPSPAAASRRCPTVGAAHPPRCTQASAAVPAGFLLFVVAWVVLCVIAFGWPYSPSNSTAAIAVFSAMPWSLLSKGVQDLADATSGGGWGWGHVNEGGAHGDPSWSHRCFAASLLHLLPCQPPLFCRFVSLAA